MEVVGLKKRMAYTGDDVLHIDETIDWKRTDEALKEAVNASKAFIRKEILKKPPED